MNKNSEIENMESSAEHPLKLSSALKERLKNKCGRIHNVSPITHEKSSQLSNELSSSLLSQQSLSKRRLETASNSFGTLTLKKRRLKYDKVEQENPCSNNSNEKEVQENVETISLSKDTSKLSPAESPADNVSVTDNVKDNLLKEKRHLELILKEKSEILRKLKMVKMYREKNNLEELQVLINTWRDVSQNALIDLHNLLPHPRPTLSELITNMNIDTHLIQYNADDECFS